MRYLLFALSYYTRLPLPKLKEYHPDDATHAIRWFSFVGIVVGLICALVFYLSASILFLSYHVSILFAIATGILVTGAFHEDGFADMADGFGGGYTKEKILAIMKDSRIGSYGVIALILVMAAKFLLIDELHNWCLTFDFSIISIFVVYHALARMTSGCLIFCSSYARTDGTAKVATNDHAWNWKEVVMLLCFGLLPLAVFALLTTPWTLTVLIPLGLLLLWFRHFCNKHIGGYTGDCLGALEQSAEVLTLLWFAFISEFFPPLPNIII